MEEEYIDPDLVESSEDEELDEEQKRRAAARAQHYPEK